MMFRSDIWNTMKARAISLTLPLVAPALLLFTWMFLAQQISNQVILPTIDQVAQLLGNPTEDLISMGSILSNVAVSLVRVVMGYAIAALVAIPLGIVMGYYGFMFNFSICC